MTRTSLPLFLALAVAACGEAPTPVERRPPPPSATEHFPGDGHDHGEHFPGDGHDHGPAAAPASGEMPRDDVHAPFREEDELEARAAQAHGGHTGTGETYSGVVRLTGATALRFAEHARGGHGSGGAGEGGRDRPCDCGYLFVSVVPAGTSAPSCFDRLDLSNEALGELRAEQRLVPFRFEGCAAPPGELELKVQFDVDGYVETKEEGVLVGRFPIARADQGIDVVLE